MTVDGDNVVDFGDIKKPFIINKLLIKVQRKVVFVTFYRLANPKEYFKYREQKPIELLFNKFRSSKNTTLITWSRCFRLFIVAAC